jgi:hypothetical protein
MKEQYRIIAWGYFVPGKKESLILFHSSGLSMRARWIAGILLTAVLLMLIILSPVINTRHLLEPALRDDVRYINYDDNTMNTSSPGHSAIFSKYVSDNTTSIIADLYSGDPTDPLTLTIITPHSVLGPFNDSSDGRKDGRIYLKITEPGGMDTGEWKFLLYSRKNISVGCIRNVTICPTTNYNYVPDK